MSKLPEIMKTLPVIMPSAAWVHTKHAIHILVHSITIHRTALMCQDMYYALDIKNQIKKSSLPHKEFAIHGE